MGIFSEEIAGLQLTEGAVRREVRDPWGRFRFLFLFIEAVGLCASLPMSASAAACPDPVPADFKKEALVPPGQLKEPIEMSVTKDGRVFVVERAGNLMLYSPASRQATVAIKLDVFINAAAYDVGGVLGVAASPEFPDVDWVYVYYAPKASFNGQTNSQKGRLTYRLSRYRFVSDHLDPASEQVLFEVPSNWETHNSGSLKFGKDGNLYLATGDNSNPFENAQYSPMDERPGHEYDDDQRSTANTNDLRGKILRIHPEAALQGDDKYYTIPKGNLFAPGLDKTRPEIFAMGFRNPYRIFPDPVTGRLFIGEFGPAALDSSARGPAGADQIKITDSAAYFGYPYFLKDKQPYCHWDYAQAKCVAIEGQAGLKYDPARPVNTSPNNTGLKILPAVRAAALWEHDGSSPDPIAGLKTCGFEAGPVYHFDPASNSRTKFPPFFDGKWTFSGYGNGGWTAKVTTVPAGPAGFITQVANPPWLGGGITFSRGIQDMEYGPGDGALYVVDYGGGDYSENSDAGLFRITYTGCLPAVTAIAEVPRAGRERYALLPLVRGQRPSIPGWARGAQVFDLAGQKIWEGHFETDRSGGNDGRADGFTGGFPESTGGGLYRVRWSP